MKILAFDIGGTNIKYALCDENFNLSDKHTISTDAEKGGQFIITNARFASDSMLPQDS